MARPKEPDQKTLVLKRTRTLNPRPDAVSDSLFKENPFFDPKDLLQVRYEMLRRHRVEVAHSHEFTMAVYGAWASWRAASGASHRPSSGSRC